MIDAARRDLLLHAISFAAKAHEGHFRKDGKTPYISHPFRVVLTLRHIFGVEDEHVLAAAVLHDTIEDTRTDFDGLERRFGAEIAGWVALLSKDKRKPAPQREPEYARQIATAPAEVQLVKLADLHDNILDSTYLAETDYRKTLDRARAQIEALGAPADPVLARAARIVLSLIEDQTRKRT